MPDIVGQGDYRYKQIDNWAKVPPGWSLREVGAVGVDKQDNVYVFNRGEHPMMVFDRDGNFLRAWGEGLFPRAHGLHMAPDDTVFLTDDGDHSVRQCTLEGKVLLTLGTPGKPAPFMSGEPFHRCTHTALSPKGEIYVSDGYGNARVHKFAADGTHLMSWGEPGTGPGQFNLPHGIWVLPDERVLVADRENDRIQVFSPTGEFITEWLDVQRPTQIYSRGDGAVYVSELQWRTGQASFRNGKASAVKPARISVYNESGALQSRLEEVGGDACASGSVGAPHSLAVDSEGSIYVGEVTHTLLVSRGHAPEGCHMFQKFARVR
jgi:DNA-binding beta-propeller fold protein YncE